MSMKQHPIGRRALAVLAFWSAVALSAAVSSASPDANLFRAPTTPAELDARVGELRAHYAPYLRSLPAPAASHREATALSGDNWRWRFEVESFAKGAPRPDAPDWWRVDLDDANWQPTRVPEWRYDRPQPADGEPAKRPSGFSRIAWYRTTFDCNLPAAGDRAFLHFLGVDSEAQVWLNGHYLGSHAGYWEPFRLEATGHLKPTGNILAVRVLAGPNLGQTVGGWSVLPTALAGDPRYVRDRAGSVVNQRLPFAFMSSCMGGGFGIHREVLLETTGQVAIGRVYARGDAAKGEMTIKADVDSAVQGDFTFVFEVMSENFRESGVRPGIAHTFRLHKGTQTVSRTVPTPRVRLWEPQTPYLYRCRVRVRDERNVQDARDVVTGYRTFSLVTPDAPREGLSEGTLLLNGQPVYLRGTEASPAMNALWYWHEDDKLLRVLLMMKAAHFNSVRAGEHVQFAEVRELMDRVGMLVEQDVPGMGPDAVGMQVLVDSSRSLAAACYNNPSVVLLSSSFETHFDPCQVLHGVLAVDGDRVMKPISGNMSDWASAYDGPPGYPTLTPADWTRVIDDFHCYYGWYGRAKGELWRLVRRYPAGRMMTVGEFGAEALDAYETMKKYPPLLAPPPIDAAKLWGNAQVVKRDPKGKVGLRGGYPVTLGEFIQSSQAYQADVIAEHATAFRLSPRRIAGYWQFHFLDALPAEWPKSIVSFDLTPKKAYWVLAQINQPVVPLLQITDDGNSMQIWLANDLGSPAAGTVSWTVTSDRSKRPLLGGQKSAACGAYDAAEVEKLDLTKLPRDVNVLYVSLAYSDAAGTVVSRLDRQVYLPAYRPEVVVERPPSSLRVPKLPDASAGGDPNKVDWSKAAAIRGWQQLEGFATDRQVEGRIAHDGRFLYIRLSEAIAPADLKNDDGIWAGDDFEVFFTAHRGSPTEPFRQIGVNPRGKFQEVASDPNLGLCRPVVGSDTSAADRWTVLLALPLDKLLPGGVKSGSVFYGNFFRQTSGTYRELLCWTPHYTGAFAVPQRFGKLTLE